ncbi:MAG: hypothetical protein AAGK97_04625 [Bacteroidota bacterium]
MKFNILFLFSIVLLSSCIGDDIVDDLIEPTLTITNALDTIGQDSSFAFNARYLNNVGREEIVDIMWQSSNPDIIAITNDGVATGLAEGVSTIIAITETTDLFLRDSVNVAVGASNVSQTIEKSGTIRTTSSYVLEGNFMISETDNGIQIDIADDYRASRALPGLFVYLTNNPATTSGALEIGRVEVFEGTHQYVLEGVGINDFSHILYFCKPFNVKVGDGEIED